MPLPERIYQCPRCLYESTLRLRMKKHFYTLKKLCPDKTDLELTEEIKQHVLDNYIYNRKTSSTVNNQTINNYNTLNNFIVKMDFTEKMGHLLEYYQKNLLGLEDCIEKRFEYRADRLENDKFRGGYFLTENDLIGLVNDATKVDKDNLDKFNIFYNKTIKRFKMYQGKDWESFIEEVGAKELVSLIKSYFLNSYELYLIRNLHKDVLTLNRFKLQEHLEIYYKFIASFELVPCICDEEDTEIVGHLILDDTRNFLADKYMKLYFEQKKTLKKREQTNIQKKIINIVKENTSQNLNELNEALMELLKIDGGFRKQIIDSKKM